MRFFVGFDAIFLEKKDAMRLPSLVLLQWI